MDRAAMLTLLQISDFHVGPPFLSKVAEAMLRLAPQLNPDVIVASGDFAQRAKASQFEEARKLLDRLPKVPLVTVPGNHDVPLYRVFERFFSPHELYCRYISPKLDDVLRIEGAIIVSLNSTAPYTAITNGRISPRQLDFCREVFQDVPLGTARIVVAHHHFAPAPDFERSFPMPKAKRAMNCFLSLGVDLILGGHLHRAYIGNSLDVYPGGAHRRGIIIVQCGTTTSRRGRARERELNTLNLIKIAKTSIEITHYMFFDDQGEFAPLSRHTFPRAGGALIECEAEPSS